ncbi:MAG: hypothetical protein NTY19_16305 [Planctomycetota bacterium]|nr:hypothetical protein [Planctomycetota bacterium]
MPTIHPRPVSPKSLRAIQDEFSQITTALGALAQAMEDQGFDELMTSNYDQVTRAIAFAHRFTGAVRQSILAARDSRGDFLGAATKSAAQSAADATPAEVSRKKKEGRMSIR